MMRGFRQWHRRVIATYCIRRSERSDQEAEGYTTLAIVSGMSIYTGTTPRPSRPTERYATVRPDAQFGRPTATHPREVSGPQSVFVNFDTTTRQKKKNCGTISHAHETRLAADPWPLGDAPLW